LQIENQNAKKISSQASVVRIQKKTKETSLKLLIVDCPSSVAVATAEGGKIAQ